MLDEAVQQIHDDYADRRPPFDGVRFPEDDTLEILEPESVEQTARILTFGSSINYNRNTTDLWEKLTRIGERTDNDAYDPNWIVSNPQQVEQIFETIRTRYPNRDANYWLANAQALVEHHDGRIDQLVSEHRSADAIIDHVNRHQYKGVSGDKIAPMWVRYVHEYAYPVENLDTLPIPVDVHVKRLTERLTNTTFDDNTNVQACWDDLCEPTNTSPIEIGKPIWLIGKHWNDWGKDYFDSITPRTPD